MSVVAQTIYRQEFLAAFERTKAVLLQTVRTDAQDRGGSLVFAIAGTGGATTVTRGANGRIPSMDDSQTQVTLNFVEDHAKRVLTNFDIFRAQGDNLSQMRRETMTVIHRKQDARIIAALEGGTVDLGAIGTMNKSVVNEIAARLGNADVGIEDTGNLFAAITPSAWMYLTEVTSFASADYIRFAGEPPVVEGLPQLGRFKHWMGINWCQHGGLTGKATSTATCLAWHRDAVGYAMSTRGVDAAVGYDDEDDFSYARASVFHAAVKLQNAGIVKFTHDDSALSS